MDNDKIITSRIEDKLEQCERGSYITATGFLNMHEQSLAMRIVKGRSDVKSFFYGGYDDASYYILHALYFIGQTTNNGVEYA